MVVGLALAMLLLRVVDAGVGAAARRGGGGGGGGDYIVPLAAGRSTPPVR